ncbi:hypothetical protein CTAYLR_000744 [Chrysophaeum taylorii]|uniref:Uncharacterized protein n=1 Tax=Chrysophaeum taylorii TaxID=2483200 RepID=A0AAD7XS90_9STRA|nr:hypothetical protein CTAYLR_000744 [Chrysophaeum taylorii]
MLGWRPKRQDAFDRRGERLWDVYSSVVLILHSFVVRVGCYAVPYMFLVLNCAYSNGAQWAPERLAFRVRQLSSTPSAGPALQAWLVILYVMTHNVLSNVLLTLTRMIQIPVQMVSHLANKWIFLGRVVDDGTQYPLRGRVHLAWMLVMRSSRMSALPPEMAYLFELIAAYATLLGVRVGKNLRLFPNPETMQAYPEADVITYGDDTIFSGHVYGHDFSSMHLRFKQTTIGNRVEATESWQVQVLPGSQIPDGIIMDAVGRSVFFEGLANEPNVAYRGNPARRVQ